MHEHTMTGKTLSRLNFIDVARSYAIVLALFSHAMIAFGGFTALGDDALKIKLFTRTATPLFVFMFGMMLELVYARKARENGLPSVVRRLVLRSAQCYLGYQLTVIAGVIGGHTTLSQATHAMFFMDSAVFGNILRLYSVAMLLAIPIIWIRCRTGPLSLVMMLFTIWLGDTILDQYSGVSLGRLDALAGILLGTGSTLDGPSVWHGMTFVFAGMLVAASLHNWKQAGLKQFNYTLLAMAAVCMAIVAWLAADVSLSGVIRRFANYQYRSHNHIGYYAVGLIACAATLFVLSRIIPLHSKMPGWTRVPLSFSRSSLLSYSLGNIILSLLPASMASQNVSGAIFASLLFLAVLLLLVSSRQLEAGYRWASLVRFEPGAGRILLRMPGGG
ncbi:MAG TPA: DUF1624 domain-containing protein [Gammaproteobacteria bacterium]|nr:DUF1624 domain-containing protein [Gammaproteobacteria bacterium]